MAPKEFKNGCFGILLLKYILLINAIKLYSTISGGGEVVRATISKSRGHEFESTWCQGFFLYFIFYQRQTALNQFPEEGHIFAVFLIYYYTLSALAWNEAGLNIHRIELEKNEFQIISQRWINFEPL